MAGHLITFEGGEGVGKSTQIALLRDRLVAAGADVSCVREPGGTVVGNAVRSILLDRQHEGMSPWTEVFLYEASRVELIESVIAPALDAGGVVLCDRFTDSTLAYQGHGRGLDLEALHALNVMATGGLTPDATVLLDLDHEQGVERAISGGAPDRLEAEEEAFHRRVREGFLALAGAEPDRFVTVDGTGTVEEVAARVESALKAIPDIAALLAGDGGS